MKISYTQLNTFEFCPTRYYIKYIFGIKEPVSDWVILGQLLHEAIPSIREYGFDATLKLYTENIQEWINKVDKHILTPEDFVAQTRAVFDVLERVLPDYDLDKAELEKEYEIDFQDHTLIGRVDYLKPDLLMDFKFKKNFRWLSPLQLGFYKILAHYEGKSGFLVFTWFKEHRFIEMDTRGTEDEIKGRVERLLEAFRTNKFDAKYKNCAHCPFMEICMVSKEDVFYDEDIK